MASQKIENITGITNEQVSNHTTVKGSAFINATEVESALFNLEFTSGVKEVEGFNISLPTFGKFYLYCRAVSLGEVIACLEN